MDNSDSSDGFEDSSINTNPYQIPCTNEILVDSHKRTTTSISCEKNGNRFLSGGNDCKVQLFDFTIMDSRFLPFRELQSFEGNIINSISHSFNDQLFITGTSNVQIKLFDRDGRFKMGSKKGDMYIVDLKKTFGHTSEVTQVQFSPNCENEFISTSVDGTLRIWDVTTMETSQKEVIKLFKGKRSAGTSCNYNSSGNLVCVTHDNVIDVFDTKIPKTHPIYSYQTNLSYHTSVQWYCNDTMMITRNSDGLYIFDNKTNKCIKCLEVKCPTLHNNVIISPDNRFIVYCNDTHLQFINSSNYELCDEVEIEKGTFIEWNDSINQIFVGDDTGHIHIFFDDTLSRNGCLSCKDKFIENLPQQIKDMNIIKQKPYHHKKYKHKQQKENAIDLEYKPLYKDEANESFNSTIQLKQDFTLVDPRKALFKYNTDQPELIKKETILQEINESDEDEYQVKRKLD
ncbi:WD domain, G-beta repeat-containing protein [Entamoeba nuttalli P19]|uniref:WD domain, G-beta repeat-containing protein n=1 Tax=Entamoeba nuttalli (strain P19) TaxID=1076696 RepID=K2GEH4_ENTNP|nr:WD domain, G-beta repeat-containing protein [Entamoeba nuttalli P19]EKE41016.1 WD domain, G-beta repeat-containing protein [Entamoeba nuttalli P19]|eukprot:XP_008856651.1 WD domain, G-beta repeat-containing protein [Entamoeba nuttalli P19]